MLSEIIQIINGQHYLAFMLVIIFSCILRGRNMLTERVRQRGFWITIVACFLLVGQEILEIYAQQDPARRDLRMITSIAGYALRPAAVLGFLMVVWPVKWRRWYLWIPAIGNAALYATAPLTDLTFGFTEEYSFYRGPLGDTMFWVCIAYLILTLIMLHKRFRDRRAGDLVVIYVCALGCLGAMAMDIYVGGIAIVSAILISSMTFYLFIRSQYMDHDPLTRLWNRMTFYEDCRKEKNAVTAIASVDMNGLKKINDELGHEAGDRALKRIARVLRENMNRKVIAYRIGGDEFVVMFLHSDEADVRQTLLNLVDGVYQSGLSVAVGVTMRDETDGSVEEMIRISDKRMFEDKAHYYQLHDRRRSR